MHVRLRYEGKVSIVPNLKKTSLIRELKTEIEKVTGLANMEQRLIYRGKQLDMEAYKLHDYKVNNNVVIDCSKRFIFEDKPKKGDQTDKKEDKAEKKEDKSDDKKENEEDKENGDTSNGSVKAEPESTSVSNTSNATTKNDGRKDDDEPKKTIREKKRNVATNGVPKSAPQGANSKPRNKLTAAAMTSHKVTDYFPIRRSERKPKKTLEEEQLRDVEMRLLADNDACLDIGVESFPEKGRGVVARREFHKGEFVVEYAGDLIDTGKAKAREQTYALDVSAGCYMYYFKHKGKQYCIDATSESGRLGRLVNHSRISPNLQTKVVEFRQKPRLILIAKRHITKDEELLYDYGDRSKDSLIAHPWLAL